VVSGPDAAGGDESRSSAGELLLTTRHRSFNHAARSRDNSANALSFLVFRMKSLRGSWPQQSRALRLLIVVGFRAARRVSPIRISGSIASPMHALTIHTKLTFWRAYVRRAWYEGLRCGGRSSLNVAADDRCGSPSDEICGCADAQGRSRFTHSSGLTSRGLCSLTVCAAGRKQLQLDACLVGWHQHPLRRA
jgi:hypothetical protein